MYAFIDRAFKVVAGFRSSSHLLGELSLHIYVGTPFYVYIKTYRWYQTQL